MKSKEKKLRVWVLAILALALDYVLRSGMTYVLKARLSPEQLSQYAKALGYSSIAFTFGAIFVVAFVGLRLICKCDYPITKYLKHSLIGCMLSKVFYVAVALVIAFVIAKMNIGNYLRFINLMGPVLGAAIRFIFIFMAMNMIDTTPEEYEMARLQQEQFLTEREQQKKNKK